MFEERELLAVLLSVGVLVFAWRQRTALDVVPNFPCLLMSFGLLTLSFICSALEVVGLSAEINFLQHLMSALSAAALFRWAWISLRSNGETAE